MEVLAVLTRKRQRRSALRLWQRSPGVGPNRRRSLTISPSARLRAPLLAQMFSAALVAPMRLGSHVGLQCVSASLRAGTCARSVTGLPRGRRHVGCGCFAATLVALWGHWP